MRRMTPSLLLPVCLALAASLLNDATSYAESSWTELSLSSSAVDQYLKDNPTHDGRGIVIAILDTGVDMDVLGLQTTTTGEMKVIDVQDFSGQGDVEIARAIWSADEQFIVRYAKDGAPQNYTPPAAEMRGDGTTVWFGTLDEKMFQNSAVSDINDNGDRDDVFGVCVIAQKDGNDDDAVCFVDTDLDRDFSDEKPLKNYKLNHDRFTFARTAKEEQREPITLALNIFTGQRKVVFHFDDGGHGTHVAGIAAGHKIQGQDGFNGVAPGAYVISLKIGHNSLAGGATTTGSKKKAFAYAARYARENNVTVVCNLSYGIGSLREGHSDVDKALNNMLRANPGVIFCTSAGNEGPGLSCVGTPAAARSAITVGALLAVDTARDVRGETINAAQLTQFSSRGGELCKPDVATPGMMTSTVPRWNARGDFWQGTSMASPYATGLCAIMAQTLRENDIMPRADWVKQALKASSQALPGFTALDYGAGLPQLPKAVELLAAIADAREGDVLYDIDLSVESPLAVGGSGEAAYWRTRFPPTDDVTFTLKPVFAPGAEATDIPKFSKRINLSCDADWIKLNQTQTYLRSEQVARVQAKYDASKLTEPGLHVATIVGEADGSPLVHMTHSVIVPHTTSAADNYTIALKNQSVDGWRVNRHYVEVPPGASAMHVTLKAVEGKPSTAHMYYVFKPDGTKATGRYPVRIRTNDDQLESSVTISDKLCPGIWELPITSNGADDQSHYDLMVRFDGVHATPEKIVDLASAAGATAKGDVTLTNVFERPIHVALSGEITGECKTVTKDASPDEDQVTMTLKLAKGFRAVRVKVSVSEKEYAKFTDCALNIYDPKGNAIAQGGLSGTEATLYARNPNAGADMTKCKLEIVPAFTHHNTEDKVSFDVEIEYLYDNPVNVKVTQGSSTAITLYPGVPAKLEYKAAQRLPEPAKGNSRFGHIHATEKRSGHAVASVKIVED